MLRIDHLKNYVTMKPLFAAILNNDMLYYARMCYGVSQSTDVDIVVRNDIVVAAPAPDGSHTRSYSYVALTPPPVNHNGEICGKVAHNGTENMCIGSIEGYFWTQSPTTYSVSAFSGLPKSLFNGDPRWCEFNRDAVATFARACELVLTANVSSYLDLFQLASKEKVNLDILF